MKRADFFKRIGAAFAALFVGIKGGGKVGTTQVIAEETICEYGFYPTHPEWNKTYVCRDGVNWEEVSLPGKSPMQQMRELDEQMKNDSELQFVAWGK